MTMLDITGASTAGDARVEALRGAVTELIAGYTEVARLLADADPESREAFLAPLRRAADSAAAVLATS